MIPRTYPSTYASNGQQQLVGFYLGSVTGLTKWVDYIPVRLGQTAPGTENAYNTDGYIPVASLSSVEGLVAFKDYVPLYIDNSATDAWTTNIAGYIPTGLSGFGGASLGLDFTTSSTLDPRITFTRASNATVTRSDGTIGYAPHNLLTYSEQFDNAAWTKARSTVTANTAVAPDGATTADKLVIDTTATTNHNAGQNYSITSGVTYTWSIYAKASEIDQINLRFSAQFPAGNTYFDLTNVTATNIGAVDNSSITSVGDGWYRCTFTQTANATGTATVQVFLAVSGSITISTANGTDGIYLWGAQLNVGALQPYYPTTVKNLLGYTQEFDNAAWTKTDWAVTANATTAPDGSLTADRLTRASTANTFNAISQASVTVVSGTRNTFSCYAKADQYTKFGLREGVTSGFYASFNLATGTIIETSGTGLTASITPAGNGWYRCEIDFPITGTSFGVRINPLPDSYTSGTTSVSWAGNTTDGIYIWGAQISDSASLDPYVYNPGAAPSAAAYYGPRFDYDPVTLAPKGLLIEEQRTNSIRNNTMQGAVAGTPGTLPTNWSRPNQTSGLTLTTSYVTSYGVPCIRLRFFGTTSGTSGNETIEFETRTSISANAGQTWTGSFYYQLVSGIYPATTFSARLLTFNSSNTLVDNIPVVNASPSVSLQRAQGTITAGAGVGTGGFINLGIHMSNWPTNTAVDFTMDVFMPQLEQGAFATSAIPTTAAAATRAADVAVMTGANFSNWYNQDEGTIYLEADMLETQFGFFRYFLALNDASGSTTNIIGLTVPSNSSNLRFIANSAGVASASLQQTLTLGSGFKVAGAYKTDDFAVSFNSGAPLTDTSGNVPSGVNTLVFGNTNHTLGAGGHSSTHYKRIAYYPRRLADAELQAITG